MKNRRGRRNAKVYLVLAVAAGVGMVAAFFAFVFMLTGDGFAAHDSSVADLMIPIFLYIGLVMLMALAMIYFLIRYGRPKASRPIANLTKKCISCGAVLSITELSCPICMALQPPR